MIGGTSFANLYYGFACEQMVFWRWLWIGQMCLCSGVAIFITLSPTIRSEKLNAIAFIVAGWSVVPGALHLYLWTDERLVYKYEIWYWVCSGVIYSVGAIIYALKCPEKCIRKRFDIVGSSHQIFHFFCLIGAGFANWGMIKVFHER